MLPNVRIWDPSEWRTRKSGLNYIHQSLSAVHCWILMKFGRLLHYGSWLKLITTGGWAASSGNAALIARFLVKKNESSWGLYSFNLLVVCHWHNVFPRGATLRRMEALTPWNALGWSCLVWKRVHNVSHSSHNVIVKFMDYCRASLCNALRICRCFSAFSFCLYVWLSLSVAFVNCLTG